MNASEEEVVEQLSIDKLRQPPLPTLVKEKIESIIKAKNLTPGSQLPTETKLANMIGVSRGTLREALRLLEEDGVTVSRHGVGTFVRSRERLVRNPLEINYGATEIIESMGLRVGTTKMRIQRTEANTAISARLQIDVKSLIVVIQRVRTANGKPVVYTVDTIPEAVLGRTDLPEKFAGSLYTLLEEEYDQKVDHGIAIVAPTSAGVEVAKKLRISTRSVVLLIDQVDYNVENRPVLHSHEYWRNDLFQFTIFRKRR